MENRKATEDLPDRNTLKQLVDRANTREAGALLELRRYLDRFPAITEQLGDVCGRALESLLGTISRGDLLLAETVRKQAETLRLSLLSPNPSPLEVLVVKRIVLAWLRLNHVDATHPAPSGQAIATKASSEREFRMALRNLELVRTKLIAANSPSPTKKTSQKRLRKRTKAALSNVGRSRNGTSHRLAPFFSTS